MKLNDEQFKQLFPFNIPRINQREIIDQILTAYQSGKHHVILNAPTGIGKSGISYTIAKYYGSAYILTSQKVLQQQYKRELNIPYMLGKSNYKCSKNNFLNCELGECRGLFDCDNIICPYKYARSIAIETKISNFNYSYFFMVNRGTKVLPQRELLISDQCHNLQQFLITTSTLKINEILLKNLNIKLKFPKLSETFENKMNWINLLKEELKKQYQILQDNVQNCDKFQFHKEAKIFNHKKTTLGKLLDEIEQLKQQYDENQQIIITHNKKEEIEYKVLYGNKLFNKMVKPYANRFLYMSATVLNKDIFCKNIGLDPNDVEYISCDSIFKRENRIIYYNPIGSMTMKNKQTTLPKMAKRIEQILYSHPEQKGIIHTVNYDIAYYLQSFLRDNFGDRILLPQTHNKKQFIDIFKLSSNPYVLISPSITEGLDLKDDLSRFCIICKVPYISLNDNWTKKRIEKDPKWYCLKAAQTLIQMTGRSIRTETDYAKTYILDEHFLTFIMKNQDLFPFWWKDSVELLEQ